VRSREKLRRDARAIFDAGLESADAHAAITRQVRCDGACLDVAGHRYNLSRYHHIYVAGAGKASARMAQAIEAIIGDGITNGLVIVKRGYGLATEKIEIVEAGHPLPDEAGLEASARLIALLEGAQADDLVLCLISGGGSALLVSPREGISLQDKRDVTERLLKSGAPIQEVNAVRKHLSQVKGGGLARSAYPATLVSLILSDVVNDPVEAIASGPTAPDPTTCTDCIRILQRYELWPAIPGAVRNLLKMGTRGETADTPKETDAIFSNVKNVVVGNNLLAAQGARQRARELGYQSCILSSTIEGEARIAAGFHLAIAREVLESGEPLTTPACLISGGETTVTVRGQGKGGRNQEFALAAALEIDGNERIVVLSAGTDGTDGPTDAAGAIVDGTTIRRGEDKGLDARACLQDNDSYRFLLGTGDLLVTGPTFTNVMDLRLMLIA
jgi:hydroxypyruvate reductase